MSENNLSNSREENKIDILQFVREILHRSRRLWWVAVALAVLGAAFGYLRVSGSYTPTYVAEATVSVEIAGGGGSSANRNTAEQMGNIFPYILTSGALSDVVAKDMGVRSVQARIRAVNIKGTNLLTISATSGNAETSYQTLQSVLKNYPAVAQYVVGQTELKVIDESGVPTDSGKATAVHGSAVRGGLIGLLLGLLIIAVHAVTFRTVRGKDDLKNLANVSYLGSLPMVKIKARRSGQKKEINLLTSELKSYSEAMRLVRTRLERRLEGGKILMVTSSIAGEGKSTAAANLAIAMAGNGRRVILVDCDVRRPSVGRIFGLTEPFPGLPGVLSGQADLESALYEVKKDGTPVGLTLLPGAEAGGRVEVLGTPEMKKLLTRLSGMADLVILDTPPSAMLVDAMMLVRSVDAVAYVVLSDYARRSVIRRGLEELDRSGAKVAGVILNGSRGRSGSYGYGYGYGYKYGYGYGSRYGSRYGSGKKEKKDEV